MAPLFTDIELKSQLWPTASRCFTGLKSSSRGQPRTPDRPSDSPQRRPDKFAARLVLKFPLRRSSRSPRSCLRQQSTLCPFRSDRSHHIIAIAIATCLERVARWPPRSRSPGRPARPTGQARGLKARGRPGIAQHQWRRPLLHAFRHVRHVSAAGERASDARGSPPPRSPAPRSRSAMASAACSPQAAPSSCRMKGLRIER